MLYSVVIKKDNASSFVTSGLTREEVKALFDYIQQDEAEISVRVLELPSEKDVSDQFEEAQMRRFN